MAIFNTAHKIVMVHEGGYANDKVDTGGETYKGVARNHWPRWAGWEIIDRIQKSIDFLENSYSESEVDRLNQLLGADDELQQLVLDFYKDCFWDVLRLDEIKDQDIAAELYDTGVNMGTAVAALFLQSALNLSNKNGKDYPDIKEDRQIGPETIAVLNKHARPKEVLKCLNILQGARYIDIMRKNPSQEKFFRSWFSRVSL